MGKKAEITIKIETRIKELTVRKDSLLGDLQIVEHELLVLENLIETNESAES